MGLECAVIETSEKKAMFIPPSFKDIFALISPLEQQLIYGFLAEKGYCLEDIDTLPEDDVMELRNAWKNLLYPGPFPDETVEELWKEIEMMRSTVLENL